MRRMPTWDGHQGMVARVYGDRIVFERRDFESGDRLGDDWIMPLPVAEPPPFAVEPRPAASVAPQFPAGAALAVRMTTGTNRGGGNVKSEQRRVLEVTIPAANRAGAGRVFDYALEISGTDGGTDRKFVLAAGFHRSAGSKEAAEPTVFQIDADLLRSKGGYKINVVPRNCFGVAGDAISC